MRAICANRARTKFEVTSDGIFCWPLRYSADWSWLRGYEPKLIGIKAENTLS